MLPLLVSKDPLIIGTPLDVGNIPLVDTWILSKSLLFTVIRCPCEVARPCEEMARPCDVTGFLSDITVISIFVSSTFARLASVVTHCCIDGKSKTCKQGNLINSTLFWPVDLSSLIIWMRPFLFLGVLVTVSFLYARLKNGRIMLYPPASVRLSVRPSVCKLFRFRVTPPTVYVRLSWNLVYMKAMR